MADLVQRTVVLTKNEINELGVLVGDKAKSDLFMRAYWEAVQIKLIIAWGVLDRDINRVAQRFRLSRINAARALMNHMGDVESTMEAIESGDY